jgi:hypothetical protein
MDLMGRMVTESGTRISKNTGYTAAQSAMSSVGKADSWWLHSPGSDCDHAASVNNYGCGSDNGLSVDSSFYAVRPALHLSLSSSSWSYAGTVSADVGESSSVTAAPGETTDPGDTTTPEESADPGDTVAPGETMAPGNTQSPRNTKTPGSTSGSASTSTPNATNTSTTNYTNRYYTPAPTVMPTASASVATKSVVTVQTPAKGRVISAKSRQGKKIVVKLANITGADGYQIKYSTKKNFKAATTRFIKKRTCTLSKLKKKTYYIKVRAYVLNYEEFEIQYGKWSSVKKVTVKR